VRKKLRREEEKKGEIKSVDEKYNNI